MGCCQSVEKTTTPSKHKDATTHSTPPATKFSSSSKSSPILEEESVKEVLPESANRPSPPTPPPRIKAKAGANAAWFPPAPLPKPDLQHPAPPTAAVDRPHDAEIASDASEIHSASESQRSTSTVPEARQEAHRKRSDVQGPWASPSKRAGPSTVGRGGGSGGGRDRSYSSSPNRSSSSRRLEGGVVRNPRRPLLGHHGSGSRNVPTTTSSVLDQDKLGGGRITRSRSPAMRSNNGDRRQHSSSSELPAQAKSEEADSIDNPLVSLECFIFL